MDEPRIFDELRERGVDADDPGIRASVRLVLARIEAVEREDGPYAARRAMEAIHHALSFGLQHPDVGDMSRFESEFDEGSEP